jgi:4-hydroxysphinganine ceramide fatty acyl 2-hydroxylase
MLQVTEGVQRQTDALVRSSERSWRAVARRTIRTVTTSRTNYVLSYAIDLACPVVLAYLGARHSIDLILALACFCVGAFVFSFIEYAIHRWFFHAPASIGTAIHRDHHVRPREPSALPCPSSAAAGLIFFSLLSPAVGAQVACFFLAGLLFAYFCYATLHHLQHRIPIKRVRLRWLQRRWAEHAIHHGRGNINFGVTTSFWDHVFGTHHPVRKHSQRP